MNRLRQLLQDRETRNYLKWRLRHDWSAPVTVPAEWTHAYARLRRARNASRRSKRWTARTAPVAAPVEDLLFPSPNDVPTVVTRIRSLLPDAVDAIVKAADSVVAGLIPLNSGGQIDTNDPEDRDSFFRSYHSLTLAKAWAYTHRAEYVERYAFVLAEWLEQHPPRASDPAWNSYTVSERMVAWSYSIPLLWDAPRFKLRVLPQLIDELALHAQWLTEHLESSGGHNHLINNGRALFLYGTWFGNADASRLGASIVEQELFRQVSPDGMLGEQSTHYHFLLTRTYVEICAARRRRGESLHDIADRVAAMVEVARALTRPDGSVPTIGDCSPDVDLASLTGYLPVAEYLLGLPMTEAKTVSEPAMWVLGVDGADALVDARCTPACNLYLPHAGYAIRKTPHDHIVFHGDPRGMVIRHGHADALALTVWSRGHEIITDAGNCSYRPDPWLTYFRGPSAHNAVTVDDVSPFVFEWLHQELFSREYRTGDCRIRPPRIVDAWWSTVGSHKGYERVFGESRIDRRVVACQEYVWVTDWASAAGAHTFASRWQIGNDTAAAAFEWRRDGQPEQPSWVRGQVKPTIEGWHSPAYGSRLPRLTAVWEGPFIDHVRLDVLISLAPEAAASLAQGESHAEPAIVLSSSWQDEMQFDPSTRELVTCRRTMAEC